MTTNMKRPGNSSFEFEDVAVLAVECVEAPIVVTSEDIDRRLAPAYASTGLSAGMLENIAGIRERRWWPEGVTFTDAARMAGEKALTTAEVSPERIGALIDTSVCKDRLEPSAAVTVHHDLKLPTSCLNFDLSNACLGFVNGMHIAGTLIDAGQIDYALIVDGEGSRTPQENTISRLLEPGISAQDIINNFATLTLGSGGAAMVLGRASEHKSGHRIIRGVSRAATQHHNLCVGDLQGMHTDARALMDAGVALSREAWEESAHMYKWGELDHYVMHQVSNVHTKAIVSALEIDPGRVPLSFPDYGNIGPASVPTTLALHSRNISEGDRVGLLGIGSGLNASVLELLW